MVQVASLLLLIMKPPEVYHVLSELISTSNIAYQSAE